MNIHFFEEFPSAENLEKCRFIDFPSVLYVAACSLSEFHVLEKEIREINPEMEAAWWPILERSYWISPFSHTWELENLYRELDERDRSVCLKVLVDLELPMLRKDLFLGNALSFWKNKRIIRKLFAESTRLNIEILTAEYPIPGRAFQTFLELLGVSYPLNRYPHKKIVMYYTSMISSGPYQERVREYVRKRSWELGTNFQVGLGTLALGIFGNEPVLEPEGLDRDLRFCQETGIDTVVLFRLGGLNTDYLDVIRSSGCD
jgi:hypothetical protein